jgi:NAD(P)-dependent dehydrogenase (short-subunit alcohol dehydrogenase family)
MKTLALELAPRFIRVNAVLPTQVATGMIMNEAVYKLVLPDVEHPTLEQAEPIFQSLNAMPIPYVQPIDISNAVLWLASDESRYVTGISLPVDAGAMAR